MDAVKQQPTNLSGLWRYSGMGIELAAAIVGLTLAGYWVDYKFGTGPKGLLIGAVVGIVGGFYNFIRQALLLEKQQTADNNKQDGADRK